MSDKNSHIVNRDTFDDAMTANDTISLSDLGYILTKYAGVFDAVIGYGMTISDILKQLPEIHTEIALYEAEKIISEKM